LTKKPECNAPAEGLDMCIRWKKFLFWHGFFFWKFSKKCC